MKDIYDRIEEIRIELGLSYKDIGDLVGISADAARKAIVARKNLKPNYINTFSDKYRINRTYLDTGEGMKYLSKEDLKSESLISHDDVQSNAFEKASIEKKLKIIFDQNSKLLKQYSEIKDLLLEQNKESVNNKNVLIDYVELSLQPIMEYIGINKKEKENK